MLALPKVQAKTKAGGIETFATKLLESSQIQQLHRCAALLWTLNGVFD